MLFLFLFYWKKPFEFWHFFCEAVEVAWGKKIWNDWSRINFHYSGPRKAQLVDPEFKIQVTRGVQNIQTRVVGTPCITWQSLVGTWLSWIANKNRTKLYWNWHCDSPDINYDDGYLDFELSQSPLWTNQIRIIYGRTKSDSKKSFAMMKGNYIPYHLAVVPRNEWHVVINSFYFRSIA